jgi:hypothetical protein
MAMQGGMNQLEDGLQGLQILGTGAPPPQNVLNQRSRIHRPGLNNDREWLYPVPLIEVNGSFGIEELNWYAGRGLHSLGVTFRYNDNSEEFEAVGVLPFYTYMYISCARRRRPIEVGKSGSPHYCSLFSFENCRIACWAYCPISAFLQTQYHLQAVRRSRQCTICW